MLFTKRMTPNKFIFQCFSSWFMWYVSPVHTLIVHLLCRMYIPLILSMGMHFSLKNSSWKMLLSTRWLKPEVPHYCSALTSFYSFVSQCMHKQHKLHLSACILPPIHVINKPNRKNIYVDDLYYKFLGKLLGLRSVWWSRVWILLSEPKA